MRQVSATWPLYLFVILRNRLFQHPGVRMHRRQYCHKSTLTYSDTYIELNISMRCVRRMYPQYAASLGEWPLYLFVILRYRLFQHPGVRMHRRQYCHISTFTYSDTYIELNLPMLCVHRVYSQYAASLGDVASILVCHYPLP